MFCEDVDLLPRGEFTALLEKLMKTPQHFRHAIASLWQTMNDGGYSAVLNQELLRFNGNLFRDIDPIALDQAQIGLLIDAARHDWSQVEPAIFGTLLERALDPEERHKLGAHYTPRAYVERLVMPTIIDPLRDEWKTVQAAAAALENQGKEDKAIAEIRAFHHKLCAIRILDPACGSGNFLYVTLEHMKRLEGEVLSTLTDLGAGQNLLEMQGNTVDPHQFLGLEINPRAAAIAEIVLWIGYLQWHFRTHGHINPPQPVIKAFDNIECRDAVLAYDRVEYQIDEETGRPIMRWDGKTYKKSPTTGDDIPDESAEMPVEVYINPRKAEWPEADYVVGNPPFIGKLRMRQSLGDGYVRALRKVWDTVPESCDFVMYWWNMAAEAVRDGRILRFGLISTNSIKQTFNRRIIQYHLDAKPPVVLAFAIPDHPWVDSSDGAAVRISMTVGSSESDRGILSSVVKEERADGESVNVRLTNRTGEIHSNLVVGANIGSSQTLRSNSNITSMGVMLAGAGFILEEEEAIALLNRSNISSSEVIHPYRNGRDLTQSPRNAYVIDLFGHDVEEIRNHSPEVYQILLDRVYPKRAKNRDEGFRDRWWLFGRPRPALRKILSSLTQYVVTVETSKHRTFQFLGCDIRPDHRLIVFGFDTGDLFGVLSSRLHTLWAVRNGGTLEDRPVYNKTRCFETFPFPEPDESTATQIATLAEQLDTHRKRQQEQHPGLTMTGMYNVLEKLRREEALTAKEKEIHEQGLVSVLRELHDDLDRAVFKAYGCDDLAEKLVGRPGATTPWPEKPEDQQEAEEQLLQRLVDLNHQRAAEEAQGKIRWLRPEYQAPEQPPEQSELATGDKDADSVSSHPGPDPGTSAKKQTWPKILQRTVERLPLLTNLLLICLQIMSSQS